jgi:AcrR family transcriptional regulator
MHKMPRKRDKEASKQALLRAGLYVFSKYGYEAATTKMVAAEAGLNEQLITRYFGGKSGLLLAALTAFVDEEANDYYPLAAEDVEAEIRQFLFYRHGRFLELQDFFRTFVPLSIVDAAIREQLEPFLLRASTLLRDRLARLQERHLVRADADLATASLMVCGQSFFISFLLRFTTSIDDGRLKRMISDFAAYVAHGLALPKA